MKLYNLRLLLSMNGFNHSLNHSGDSALNPKIFLNYDEDQEQDQMLLGALKNIKSNPSLYE